MLKAQAASTTLVLTLASPKTSVRGESAARVGRDDGHLVLRSPLERRRRRIGHGFGDLNEIRLRVVAEDGLRGWTLDRREPPTVRPSG